MKNIYKKLYNTEERNYDLVGNKRVWIMTGIINNLDLKNKKILDIGCYDGTQLSLIKNKENELYGAEASEYGIKKCKEKGIIISDFFFDDKTNFPFENEKFDLVIAGEIIEHIYDTDFFLSEIRRILKPDGYLLISTPNIASFGRRLMLFFGISPIIETTPNEKNSSGHIRYFTFKTLTELLNKHSFKIMAKRSDIVNFSSTGNLSFTFLVKILPSIGSSLICLCRKQRG